MFGRQKRKKAPIYDKSGKIPVIRSSICTGEQVAGFKDPISGKFDDLMLIRDSSDLSDFLSQYQVNEGDIQRNQTIVTMDKKSLSPAVSCSRQTFPLIPIFRLSVWMVYSLLVLSQS